MAEKMINSLLETTFNLLEDANNSIGIEKPVYSNLDLEMYDQELHLLRVLEDMGYMKVTESNMKRKTVYEIFRLTEDGKQVLKDRGIPIWEEQTLD